jgi:uncharacterized protein YutE (UPF0331/DUF86 family)
MVNRNLLAAKLAELSDRIARARKHCPPTPEELRADRDALDLVSFNLMLAVQSCADLASHLIADEEWPAAASLAEAFERLHERGVLLPATAMALGRAAGLRNIVAHGYGGVDAAIVPGAVRGGLVQLEAFSREVAAWAASQPSR